MHIPLHRDRIAGLAFLTLALWYALEARSFTIPTVGDPLGPRVFPLALALGLSLSSLYLIARPSPAPAGSLPKGWLRMVGALLCLVGYAYLLVPLGFIPATTLVMTLLAWTFNGTLWRSLIAALLFSIVLYALFAYALGLNLPMGTLFT